MEKSLPPDPLIEQVKDFVRCLIIAEKNYSLYPPEGKVVQQSLQALLAVFETYMQAASRPLSLQVRPQEFLFADEVVYSENAVEKNLAYRLHRDFIQEVVFLEGIGVDEFLGFIDCLRQVRKLDGGDIDLYSLLWEREFAHIQVELIDKFTSEDLLSSLPPIPDLQGRINAERFRLEEAEEKRCREVLRTHHEASPDGERVLELTDEDLRTIALMATEEESRSPLHDFVDILLEVQLRKSDRKCLQQALNQVAALLCGLIAKGDFGQAARLLRRIRDETRWRLSDAQRHALEETLKIACDKTTLKILAGALDAHSKLPAEHDLFQLMLAFGESGLPGFCELLRSHKHTDELVITLADLGKGCVDIFCQYLSDPDPVVAQAAVDIVLGVDPRNAEKIAPALKHPHQRVKLHVVRRLIPLGNERIGAQIIQILTDPALEVVEQALQFFSSVACSRAYDALLEFGNDVRFYQLGLAAQENFFKALVLADRGRGLRYIGRSVLFWGFSMSSKSVLRKVAAVLALKYLRLDSGILKILKRLAKRKYGPLGKAAREVLQARSSVASLEAMHCEKNHVPV